ncbi:MAG: DNA repair protein RecO [Legionellaceae bacterium]|nr:DNA repair protein RecO [Legionellaceae bacterium]HAF87046.1 DNA repair protein RecO [Legionellales bacterium]HCA90163.1 DNA repair protein RecO [Legionellales bacterium]|tara:strand:+ start:1042 stop:1734 length:693 start_codon:yes stop_codon:yes gene_type:complete
MNIESFGWLIHKRRLGETSLQLTLFTEQAGLIRATYRGGVKKMRGLEAFQHVWLDATQRYQAIYIKKLECLMVYHLSPANLISALYLNELIYYAFKPLEPFPATFKAYEQTLKVLSQSNEQAKVEEALRQFELILLKECGYGFSLTHEAFNEMPIKPDKYYQFVVGTGFVEIATGWPGNILLALADNDFSCAKTLKSAKVILRQAIDDLIDGRMLKSRQLWEAIHIHVKK